MNDRKFVINEKVIIPGRFIGLNQGLATIHIGEGRDLWLLKVPVDLVEKDADTRLKLAEAGALYLQLFVEKVAKSSIPALPEEAKGLLEALLRDGNLAGAIEAPLPQIRYAIPLPEQPT
jgi:hypothetical protein